MNETSLCPSYSPGHQMHWIHWRHARMSTPVAVSAIQVEGFAIRLDLGVFVGDRLLWRHHEPVRLLAALTEGHGPVLAYLDWHALKIGDFWFNCAGKGNAWRPCPASLEFDVRTPRALPG